MYHRYEQGQVPKENNLRVIADKCGVSVDWLLGRDQSDSLPLAARDHHHVDYGAPSTIHGAAARSALARQERKQLAAFDAQDRARLTEFWQVVESVTPLMLRGGPNVEVCRQMIRAALDDLATWCQAIKPAAHDPETNAPKPEEEST
jgi:hypothetical protein